MNVTVPGTVARFLSVSDAARALGVHRVRVWRWAKRGWILAQRSGSRWLIAWPLHCASLEGTLRVCLGIRGAIRGRSGDWFIVTPES
jgi:excisionase family DNA binding protein